MANVFTDPPKVTEPEPDDLTNEQNKAVIEKILIVDDMLVHLETAQLYLEKSGYQVFCASDTQSAWELLQDNKPSLLLLDIVMPGGSGLDLLHEIQNHHPQIGVVIMTAFGNEEIAAMAMKTGALDYIRKPVKYSDLTNVVANALAKQREINNRSTAFSNLKVAYEELRVSADSLLQCMSAGVVALDNNLRITMINYAAEKLLNVGNRKVVGNDFYAAFPDLKKTSLLKQTLVNEKGLRLQEVRLQEKDEEKIYSVNTDVLFDHRGRKIGVVAVFDDITEHRRYKDMLSKREGLAMVGQMAAGMAHELKNPLTSIKGFAQLILAKIQDPKIKEYLTIMDEEINQMDQVIRDFLQLARPRSPKFTKVDLNLLLVEAISIIEPQAFLKGIKTSLNTDTLIPKSLMDPGQIKQLILNLTQNAIEVMDGGGTLVIEAKYIAQANEIRLTVSDSGCGIPSEKIKKLGVPFYTTKPEGTGLGLSIVFSIVDQHGGRLNIESEEGCGTTFAVILPVK